MITRNKIISFASLVVFLNLIMFSVSTAQDNDTTKGNLGYPLGTRLIIKGMRHAMLMTAAFVPCDDGNAFLVDTVDGKKLETPIGIPIDDKAKTKNMHSKNFRYTFIGSEKGKWIGGKLDEQAAYQFYRIFVVDSVLSPTALDTIKSDSTRK